ncbi:hypothetical protein SADO_08212 [Salinisphaera dokdonensis CL-ES53]|uniref:DUF5343 domain-containing protein n=1 Tax=Salinisphaera dokdonensis CL-ES53 TaxID=1304272 RepID=A0ABV2B001_9GAMM
MDEDAFKLPGSSYAELAKIIRAYGHSPDQASPKDVAERAIIDPTQVSRNNAFLLNIGIIQGKQKKTLTSHGRNLAKALDFEMPNEISSAWREMIIDSSFFRKIISAVRIRGGMEPSALRSHIAYTAGATKKSPTMVGAGALIDIMKAANVLEDEDGTLIIQGDFLTRENAVSMEPAEPDVNLGKVENEGLEAPVKSSLSRSLECSGTVSATLNIQVSINCTPDEISTLGPRLRELIRVIENDTEDDDSSDA